MSMLSEWIQMGFDIDGEAEFDRSGWSVSLSDNGMRVAIGAITNDDNGNASGHTRVYEWDGSSWIKMGDDINGDTELDRAGVSVSLSGDGTIVAIGAGGNDGENGNNPDSGHTKVYKWNTTSWVQLGADIDGEFAGDQSGVSVSLSNNGTRVAIGAYLNDGVNGNNPDSGHTRVYELDGSNTWVQLGADIDGEDAFDRSGLSVSLSGDGKRVAIGARLNNGNVSLSGHTRVYEWNSTSLMWIQMGLDIDGESINDESGFSVSLSGDGSIVAIGAIYNDGNGSNSGHTKVYKWDGSAWMQMGVDIDGEAFNDQSGVSVSLSNDGSRLAIGAGLSDIGDGLNPSYTRVYEWNVSEWVKIGINIDEENVGDSSGYSVSLSGDGTRVAIGARFNDGNGTDSGHTRVYEFNVPTTTEAPTTTEEPINSTIIIIKYWYTILEGFC